MKKVIILSVILFLLFAAGVFYYFRGALPAITQPPQDIAEILDNQNPGVGQNSTDMPLKLLPGFSISIFAKDLGAPRVMIWDPSNPAPEQARYGAGRLLVSIPSQGKVVALPDEDVNGVADKIIDVAINLNRPHGLALDCQGNAPNQTLRDGTGQAAVQQCKLYVGETDKISVFDYDQALAKASNKTKIADLPSGSGHFTRTLGFGPDGRLYVSIGSSCNVCNEADTRRAKIFSLNKDGSDFKEFARGLRNSVFFTWHPKTFKMWATEMGRDLLGDNIPPDEINIVEEGKNYGWPICYGQNIHDTAFDKNVYVRNPCLEPFETPSYIDIAAHSAPLGLAFFPHQGWPQDFWDDLLVAYHGSWNRSEPTGYKIVHYKLDEDGNLIGSEDFISGWLTGNSALGRPVDILILPGGLIYISDDHAGVIYKVTYNQ